MDATVRGPKPKPAIERFVAKVGDADENGCWPWLACKMRGGHGQFYADRQRVLAHRFAYELLVGPIPGDRHLHHTCENPSCVNPDHLALMTSEEHTRLHQTRPFGETCSHGHLWEPGNIYYSTNRSTGKRVRACKECRKAHSSRRYYEVVRVRR